MASSLPGPMPLSFNRRTLLRGAAGAALLPACGGGSAGWLASATGDSPDSYGITALSAEGDAPLFISTGFRGHGLAASPRRPGRVFLFERRPGVRIVEIDLREKREVRRGEVQVGRALAGHGCLSEDGSRLYTTEIDTESGAGTIGVRQASTLEWLDELETGGLGPHELITLPDGRLAVANGGLKTDAARRVVNLGTMDPSLALLDLRSRQVELHRLPHSKASIRHLDVDGEGSVVVGLQVQREAVGHDGPVPVAARWSRTEGFVAWPLPPEGGALEDYVGSVSVSAGVAGLTSPRGDVAMFLNARTGALLDLHAFADASGIAARTERESFLLTSSFGQVRTFDTRTLDERRLERRELPGTRWDNHARWVPGV
ncbi:MAG: DUF1513 domain-containing protein [Myxococcota bacterium]